MTLHDTAWHFCRLHYNPVMDEWVSLSDDVIHPRQVQDSDMLFDLHKIEGPALSEEDEEVIKIGEFLEVKLTKTDRMVSQKTCHVFRVWNPMAF